MAAPVLFVSMPHTFPDNPCAIREEFIGSSPRREQAALPFPSPFANPPPGLPRTRMPQAIRRRLALLFTLPDLAALDGARFAVLVLGLLAAGLWMGVEGIESHAGFQRRRVEMELKARASSPLLYRQPLRVEPAGAARPAGGLAVLVRADSVPAAEEARLCGLLRGAPGVRWYSLSAGAAGCARESASARVSVAAPGDPVMLRAARWVLVDGDSLALYSLRELPSPAEARRIAATFTPPVLPTPAGRP